MKLAEIKERAESGDPEAKRILNWLWAEKGQQCYDACCRQLDCIAIHDECCRCGLDAIDAAVTACAEVPGV